MKKTGESYLAPKFSINNKILAIGFRFFWTATPLLNVTCLLITLLTHIPGTQTFTHEIRPLIQAANKTTYCTI